MLRKLAAFNRGGLPRTIQHRTGAFMGRFVLPEIRNEKLLTYEPGSIERERLKAALKTAIGECPDIPCIVGGKEIRTGDVGQQVMPTEHRHISCTFHNADSKTLHAAADSAAVAKEAWFNLPFDARAAVFLKAADLLSTKYRAAMCAVTMLGTGKTVWQAEIDCAAETADFWRFNTKFAYELYAMQPCEHSTGTWNRLEHRPLEGFVMAIAPFNFLAIASNLACAPMQMGNAVVLKPSSNAVLGSYLIYKILEEAGLPAGVLNFVPCHGPDLSAELLPRRDMAGVHFTGSTDTFAKVWQGISHNLRPYHCYPRIVGETGGKNFHFVHESADLETVANSTVRGAFEYQGQKCSATSRMYVPSNKWPALKERLVELTSSLKVGDVRDMTTFMTAVIDKRSFDNIVKYIEIARNDPACKIIAGGKYDDSVGYFIQPTIIETTNPKCTTMSEEIFGPVLTIYAYDPKELQETLRLCDTSKYALTGAIFAEGRDTIEYMSNMLRYSAGNFYINDKSTGAVVGQQPFGGGRGSGTNDKSGSMMNLMRWVSTRSVKENFLPVTTCTYPSMRPE